MPRIDLTINLGDVILIIAALIGVLVKISKVETKLDIVFHWFQRSIIDHTKQS